MQPPLGQPMNKHKTRPCLEEPPVLEADVVADESADLGLHRGQADRAVGSIGVSGVSSHLKLP